MYLYFIIGNINGYIGKMQKQVGKIFFDNVALIPEAYYKLSESIAGI
jgi:hypothetical protein